MPQVRNVGIPKTNGQPQRDVRTPFGRSNLYTHLLKYKYTWCRVRAH